MPYLNNRYGETSYFKNLIKAASKSAMRNISGNLNLESSNTYATSSVEVKLKNEWLKHFNRGEKKHFLDLQT